MLENDRFYFNGTINIEGCERFESDEFFGKNISDLIICPYSIGLGFKWNMMDKIEVSVEPLTLVSVTTKVPIMVRHDEIESFSVYESKLAHIANLLNSQPDGRPGILSTEVPNFFFCGSNIGDTRIVSVYWEWLAGWCFASVGRGEWVEPILPNRQIFINQAGLISNRNNGSGFFYIFVTC